MAKIAKYQTDTKKIAKISTLLEQNDLNFVVLKLYGEYEYFDPILIKYHENKLSQKAILYTIINLEKKIAKIGGTTDWTNAVIQIQINIPRIRKIYEI